MGVSTNVAGWTSDEVSTWLAGLGLGHLAAEFTKNAGASPWLHSASGVVPNIARPKEPLGWGHFWFGRKRCSARGFQSAAQLRPPAVNGEDLLSLSDADLTAHLGTTSLQTRKIRQGLSRLIAGGDAPGGAAGGGGGVAPLVQQAPPTPPAPMEDAKYDIDKSPTFSSFSPAASRLLDGVPAVAAAPQPPYMAGLASEGLGADSSAVVPILTRYLPAYCAILTALVRRQPSQKKCVHAEGVTSVDCYVCDVQLVFAIADSVLLGQVIAKNKSNGYDDVCTSWCALSVTCNTFTLLSFLVLLPLQVITALHVDANFPEALANASKTYGHLFHAVYTRQTGTLGAHHRDGHRGLPAGRGVPHQHC